LRWWRGALLKWGALLSRSVVIAEGFDKLSPNGSRVLGNPIYAIFMRLSKQKRLKTRMDIA
jgi:hypothetical protein